MHECSFEPRGRAAYVGQGKDQVGSRFTRWDLTRFTRAVGIGRNEWPMIRHALRARRLPASGQWIPPRTPHFTVRRTVPQMPTIQVIGERNPGFSRAEFRTPPPCQGNPTTSGVSHTNLTERESDHQRPLWVRLWGTPKPATTKWAFSLRTVARCLGVSGLILG